MRLNSRGEILAGVGRAWLTDDLSVQQIGSDAAGWKTIASNGEVLDEQGFNTLAAGGGKWATWLDKRGPKGNFGPLDPAGIVMDIGPDGTVAWCPNYQAGMLVEGSVALSTRVCGPGHIVYTLANGRIWSNLLGYASIPDGVVPFRASIVNGALLYHTHEWLVLQQFHAPVGIVVAPKPAYSPDMIAVGSLWRVVWCLNEGETQTHERVIAGSELVNDLRSLRDFPESVPVPAPVPVPIPVPPNPRPSMPFDFSATSIVDSPSDLASWHETATITRVDFSSGKFVVDFDRRTGSNRWPESQKAGDPDTQYTLGLACQVNGRWYASGVVQFWFGRELEAGSGVDEIGATWFYDGRWGPLQGHQPARGETVGIFVGQGNLRGGHGSTPLRERSAVLLLPWGQNYNATSPVPVPVPVPTPTPAPLPTGPTLDAWIHGEFPELVNEFKRKRPELGEPGNEWAAFQTYRRYVEGWSFARLFREV